MQRLPGCVLSLPDAPDVAARVELAGDCDMVAQQAFLKLQTIAASCAMVFQHCLEDLAIICCVPDFLNL